MTDAMNPCPIHKINSTRIDRYRYVARRSVSHGAVDSSAKDLPENLKIKKLFIKYSISELLYATTIKVVVERKVILFYFTA